MRREGLSLRERARAEREKLRAMAFRQRIGYLVSYYKLALLGLLLLLLALFLLADAVREAQKTVVLQGFITNDDANWFDAAALERDYRAGLGLAPGERVLFDDSLYIALDGTASAYTASSRSKIFAYMAAGELDFVITRRDVLESYAGLAPMQDLETLLPPDLLERVRPQLFRREGGEGGPAFCALDLGGTRYVAERGAFYLFVPSGAPHAGALIAYLRYLFAV